MTRPLIYIAGPYTNPDPVENTHNAIHAAEAVEALGADVFIPHLSLLWHLVSPAPIEKWYGRDNAVLVRCDAVYRMDGQSTGADAEVSLARGRGIPVLFGIGDAEAWFSMRRERAAREAAS